MARPDEIYKLLRGYLLGELSAEESAFISRKSLIYPWVAAELLAAEDELIDLYLGGELTAAESEKFEQHFLQDTARVAKLQFSTIFHRYLGLLMAGAVRGRSDPL